MVGVDQSVEEGQQQQQQEQPEKPIEELEQRIGKQNWYFIV